MDKMGGVVGKALKGVDLEELGSKDGWRGTSAGAEFGKRKKGELLEALRGCLADSKSISLWGHAKGRLHLNFLRSRDGGRGEPKFLFSDLQLLYGNSRKL